MVTLVRFCGGKVFIAILLLLLLVTTISHVIILNTDAYPYKRIHNASHEITLTPAEWADEFKCHIGNINQTTTTTIPDGSSNNNNNRARELALPRECYREDNSWLIKHNLEMWHAYKFLVREDSIDERYANVVFGYNSRQGIDYHHYLFNSGDPKRDKLHQQQVAGAQVDDKLCKQQLRLMVTLLEDLSSRVDRKRRRQKDAPPPLEERHFRLARVLDSYGRHEAGQLNGRYQSFGMYHQCVRTPMLLDATNTTTNTTKGNAAGLVRTRYCWARMNLDQHAHPLLRDRNATDYKISDFKYHMATCLPVSCHSKSFTLAGDDNWPENSELVQRLIDSQYRRPRSVYIDSGLPLESVFCLPDEDSQVVRMAVGGRLFVVFILSWLALCALATIKRKAKHDTSPIGNKQQDCLLVHTSANAFTMRPRRNFKSFLSHFDLFESWQEFTGAYDVDREHAPVDLNALSLLKTLTGAAVFATHTILTLTPLNANAQEGLAMMENNRTELLIVTGNLVLDSLFVITGMLMAFIVMKRLHKLSNPLDRYSIFSFNFYTTWLYVAASRYVRLVPLYFLAFWFKKTVFTHLGSGPNWDHGLNRNTLIGACKQESWLSPFTPMTAFTPLFEGCFPQSWSISNDLFFAFLAPPFIISLYKHFKVTSVVIVLTTVGSILGGYLTYLGIDTRYRFMLEQLTARGAFMIFRVASVLYTHPVYRVPAVFIGVFAGYALYKYERAHDDSGGGGGGGGVNNNKAAAAVVVAVELDDLKTRGNDDDDDDEEEVAEGGAQSGAIQTTVKPPGWPRWFRGFATQQAVIYVVVSFVFAVFFIEFRDNSSDETKRRAIMYFFINCHFNWSLAIAIILMRIVTDWKDSWLIKTSSRRLFRSMGKLAYPMLLIHWDIMYYDAMVVTQSTQANKWQYARVAAATHVYAWLLGTLVHLVLENPIDKLTKTYILKAGTEKNVKLAARAQQRAWRYNRRPGFRAPPSNVDLY